MLDFVVLASFAYLIFRIVSRGFSNIEQLFVKSPPSPPGTAQAENASKPKEEPRPASPYRPPISLAQKSNASRDSDQPSSAEKVGKVQGNAYQVYEKEEAARVKASIEREDVQTLRAELADSLAEIERLQEEIQGHKKEKAGYVARIEDIIQHVIDNQAPAPQISAEQQQNDEEMKVLGELTKEIDHVHQQEVQRLTEREEELTVRMAKEKEVLERHYLSQIEHISQQLKAKSEELSRQAEEIQNNEQARVALEQDLLATGHKQEALEEQLAIAHHEIEELRVRLTKFAGQESTGVQGELRVGSQGQQAGQYVLQQVESQQLRARLEELNANQLEELSTAKQEAADLRDKLRQLREESNIVQNDRLEADIKLAAQVESLEQLKAEMEAQITQLNEGLFREEQERNQRISEVKQELVAKYEAQLEKEQEGRKETERKLSEAQSELEFVQAQLKSTLESERKLTAELEALRSPKKVSVVEVQSHAEYQKLKRKVEELEGEISQSRAQLPQELKEGTSPDRKINYARTKVERQASPTFQFESKDRTPPSSSSRSKDVVSTIFVGSNEKVGASSSIRYQTPLQKPVAQSSILEGGLLSEGFLGETNILGQKQREFLIGEIKTLKKIDVKKARLLYRSLGGNPRPISEYTSNVPNVLVVVELSNKKLLGAFTQAAFTRELGNQPERKYSPANKAMIIDISDQRIILNASAADTIHYDQRALIWGRNELVVSSEQPLLLSCDLNCEQAVYPCDFSSQDLLGSTGRSCPISQFEVYRIFLG